ncbi:hypothetical protein BD408DRAFT_337831, partial [Parasitella parasitica]
LIIGLRQGSILCIQINIDHQDSFLNEGRIHIINDIGPSAVVLRPCQDGIYALSGRLWKISCDNEQDVRLDRVLAQKFDFINAFCLFDCGLPMLHGARIALIADEKLHVYALSPSRQLCTRKIQLKDTPRKIVYHQSLDYLIALTMRMTNGDRKNFIRLIDPLR